jgi:hypothetical protein
MKQAESCRQHCRAHGTGQCPTTGHQRIVQLIASSAASWLGTHRAWITRRKHGRNRSEVPASCRTASSRRRVAKFVFQG